MIVSHSRKFIFIKAYKVAGTSVQHALAQTCDDNDLIIEDVNLALKLDQHASPLAVRKLVGDKIWNSYRKIVIVRNPWDAFVSHYFFAHLGQNVKCPSYFDVFVWWNINGSMPLNKKHWLIGGKKWADDYIRFEDIEVECKNLFIDMGINFAGLGNDRSGLRPTIHYSLLYDLDTMRMVAKTYKDEIEQFGYKFEHIFQNSIDGSDNTEWKKIIQV